MWFDYCLKGFDDNCGLCIDVILVILVFVECCVELGIDYELCGIEKLFDYVLIWLIFNVW